MVVRLSQLSGRALAAQARGVLGSTTGGCQPFHFPLFSPHNMQMDGWVNFNGKITSLHVVTTRKNGQVILATEELCAFINPSSLLTQSVVDGMHLQHGKTG